MGRRLTYNPFGGSLRYFTFRLATATVEESLPKCGPRTVRRPSPSALGERVRQLRIARGLTQTELGLGRFSKEYISQIERGRARPAQAALDWLADRLGTSRRFIETGLSSADHERTASLISRAEAAVAAREFEEALTCLEETGPLSEGSEPELALRAMLTGATARSELGRVKEALALLERAGDLVAG